MKTTVLDHGIFKKVDKLDDNHIEFPSSSDFFSMPSNMITGVGGVSGGRVLLGAKATLQSIPLIHRERALVESSDGVNDETTQEKFGKHYLSVTSKKPGVVESLDDDHITVKNSDGTAESYQLYHNYNLGRKSFVTHDAIVKVGDKVKANEVMATSNYTDKHGNLAIGVNLKTAIMPYRSANFEDAYAVTESGAKKLAAEQMIKFHLEKKFGIEMGKDKFVSLFPHKYTNEQISKVDGDGVVKVGSVLTNSDPILLAFSPKALKSTDLALGKLSKVLKNAYKDNSEYWDYEHSGKVVDVAKHGDLVTVHVITERTLLPGDKIGCVPDDHQVLTIEGWKPINKVSLTDQVYTLNPNSHNIELLNPISLPAYDYDGQLYKLNTTQVSITATPEHKFYAKFRKHPNEYNNSSYGLHTSSSIAGKRYKLKNNANWTGRSPQTIKIGNLNVPIKTYLTILGLFLGDGSTFWHEKSGSYGFDICQKKPAETQIIHNILTELGIKFYKGKSTFRVYSKAWAAHLKQFGKAHDKFIPNAVFAYSRKDLAILYKYLMLTDGCEKGTTHCYYTVSNQLANDVQRLALHIGYAAKLTYRERNKWVTFPDGNSAFCKGGYEVFIYREKHEPEINHGHHKNQNGQSESWESYQGKVYCLTFKKNHVFYIRHNGKCHWTGNSIFGAKGVATIVPDSQAPTTEDGKPVDILLNSMSITSRVAPALPVALGLGKLAEKRGKTVKMRQFTKDSSIETVIDELAKNKISDVEKLYDPVTGQYLDAVVGPLYYNRLTHISEDKLSSRSQGIGYSFDNQPTKTDAESSKRIGNLGTTALLSHNVKDVLEDIGTVRGTKNEEFWRALKLGQTPPPPKVPFIFNKFISSLQGAGVNVTRQGSIFNIMPLTDKDTTALSQGSISKPKMFKPFHDELIHEEGGLFDPTNVGVLGDRFNHINLNMPVPNPISEDYLRKLIGVTKKQFDELVISGEIVKTLNDIDLDSKIAEMRKYISSGKKTKRDDAAKILQFLTTLKSKKLKPSDLMLTKIPVIPAMYRPVSKMGNVVLTSDVNNLYKDLMMNNNALKDTTNVPTEVIDKLKTNQYAAVKAVFGLGDPINKKHADKNVKGLLATLLGLKGGTAKSTMFQSKVVNKSLDLVGRAVLTPDAKLDVDQASVPQDMLWQVYKPFITRRLVIKGIPAIQAAEYVKKKNELAIRALHEELQQRPGIISRDPAWHKFNLMGFHLIPNANPKDKTIKMNPLVFKGFGADNDGDQLNINIPATDAARKEVLAKMLPSKNLLSPKSFHPVLIPSNESALGLYGLSTENNHGVAKNFKNEQEVVNAYQKGTIAAGDAVEIG